MIRECTLFSSGKHENEANKFVAELLINEAIIENEQLTAMLLDQLSCFLRSKGVDIIQI